MRKLTFLNGGVMLKGIKAMVNLSVPLPSINSITLAFRYLTLTRAPDLAQSL